MIGRQSRRDEDVGDVVIRIARTDERPAHPAHGVGAVHSIGVHVERGEVIRADPEDVLLGLRRDEIAVHPDAVVIQRAGERGGSDVPAEHIAVLDEVRRVPLEFNVVGQVRQGGCVGQSSIPIHHHRVDGSDAGLPERAQRAGHDAVAVQVLHAGNPHAVGAGRDRVDGGDDDGAGVPVEHGHAGDGNDRARAVGHRVVGRVAGRGQGQELGEVHEDLVDRVRRDEARSHRRRSGVGHRQVGHHGGDARRAGRADNHAVNRAVVRAVNRAAAERVVGRACRRHVREATGPIAALPEIDQFAAAAGRDAAATDRGDRDKERSCAARSHRGIGDGGREGDDCAGVAAKVAVVVKLSRGLLLNDTSAHVGVHRETEIQRRREDRLGRKGAVALPVYTVGAGVAREAVARAAKAHPNVGETRDVSGVGTPTRAGDVPVLTGAALDEIASRQLRIGVDSDVWRVGTQRDASVEAALVRRAQRIQIRHTDLDVEVAGLLRVNVAEAIEVAEDVMPASGDRELVRSEAVVHSRQRANLAACRNVRARRFPHRIHIEARQPGHRAVG